MQQASAAQQFERAARYRDTLGTMRRLAVRQRMSSVGLEEQDYLAHHAEGEHVALQLFQMRQGKVQARREFRMDLVDFEPGAFYAAVLGQSYAELEPPPEIFLPAAPEQQELLERWLGQRRGGRVRIRVPLRGAKRRFLELVRKNAQLAFEARYRVRHTHGVEGLEGLATLLKLDEPPYRIECFDISNTHGTDAVASLVVWEGAKPKKSEYRSFHIRGVDGPDDFASIAEAVTRRYRRLLAEDRRLPDLVLVDGVRHGVLDLVEPVFDALGDFNLTLARQELNCTHFAHVHSNRIGCSPKFSVDTGQCRFGRLSGIVVIGDSRVR